jgi:carboxylate-amine ligase
MVLDPVTLDLASSARQLLDAMPRGHGFKLEMPASQLEIVTRPHSDVEALTSELHEARLRLVAGVGKRAMLAAAGAHPFAAPEGELNRGERYQRMALEYGVLARRQLVCGLHVHVGLSGAERVLAVYNALRGYLPEIAALGANAPLRAGRDTGLASVRPLIAGLLPRQGVPPIYESWEQLACDLKWGAAAAKLEGSRGWWWELRLHPELGTLEIRVPDAQSTVADAAALLAVACALVLWLARRHDDGEHLAVAPAWRIAENRMSALRDGVHGTMLDLQTGEAVPTQERLHELLEAIGPLAEGIGGGRALAHARTLIERNGADRQREAAQGGVFETVEMLCADFLAPA